MAKRTLILASIIMISFLVIFAGIQTARANVTFDLNHSGKVGMEDVGLVVAAFGSRAGDDRYDPKFDFDGNGKVNMRDIGMILLNYGLEEGPELVTPEYPLGPILGLTGFFAALGVFRFAKRSPNLPRIA